MRNDRRLKYPTRHLSLFMLPLRKLVPPEILLQTREWIWRTCGKWRVKLYLNACSNYLACTFYYFICCFRSALFNGKHYLMCEAESEHMCAHLLVHSSHTVGAVAGARAGSWELSSHCFPGVRNPTAQRACAASQSPLAQEAGIGRQTSKNWGTHYGKRTP